MRWQIIFAIVLILTGCQDQQYASFDEWLGQQDLPDSRGRKDTLILFSGALSIDTIYRSMEGPFEIAHHTIQANSPLIWLTGYHADIVDAGKQTLSDQFMCHSNLNLPFSESYPWPMPRGGAQIRLFTLAEGQASVMLPEGFGIPLPSNRSFEIMSQVLNHMYPDTQLLTHHKTQLIYQEATADDGILPLYQKAVFITKQVAGPEGPYGSESDQMNGVVSRTPSPIDTSITQCAPPIAVEMSNPLRDDQGRSYTAHWQVPPGRQYLETDVTQMLALEKMNRVHAIGVHVHPFAEKIGLWNTSTGEMVWETTIKNKHDRVGLEEVPYYSSDTGLALYPDQNYALRCSYANPTQDTHTAMAVLFLYVDRP